jgi:large subunit ribosomal protein L3
MKIDLLATKVGMSSLYDGYKVIPVTLLQVAENVITDIKNGVVQIGFFDNVKNVAKPQLGVFAKKGVTAKRKIREFTVTEVTGLEVGKPVPADRFTLGESVDITGITKGRGFTGVMKRHNFKGLEATHGVSVSHRSHGSTGQRQDPGRVFKGKKMAGHYGTEQVTVQNLKIVQIDAANESGSYTIAIKGSIPGCNGSVVKIKTAAKKINAVGGKK